MSKLIQYLQRHNIKHYYIYAYTLLFLASCTTADAGHQQTKAENMHKSTAIAHAKSELVTTNSTPNRFEAPYPFTVEDLWQNLLKVIATPNRYVTKADVEKIFKIQLKYDDDASKFNHQPVYVTTRGVDWYFGMSVMEVGAKSSSFYFSWGQIPGRPSVAFPRPHPDMCVKAQDVLSAIKALGWHETYDLTDYTHGLPPGKQLEKNSAILTIFFDYPSRDEFYNEDIFTSNCLLNLRISKR